MPSSRRVGAHPVVAPVVVLLFAWVAIMFQVPSASAQTATGTTHSATAYDAAIQSAQLADLKAATPSASRAGMVSLGAPAPCREVFVAAETAGIPAGSTADVATSGSRISSSVRGQYFQDGAEPPTCSYCQQNPAEHLDHVIPRSQGGDLSPDNLTPSCAWCNLSKGARVAPVNRLFAVEGVAAGASVPG